ncbi:olfactory receptor 2M2-like [Bos indicus x Bos taurus]|uniref:olfactory receptor family 2 subfamily M member 15 n=1 Tax=Bos taurus TaxID=9913 RepID=UPI0000EBE1C8|nr:olfactory receptor family 2 subfamily M member 15 [Bos taurus]XP_027380528.1 olfactory receptor 2M2-like [Bos indicus x Bos taurus]DAA16212.1 TPA: olfactory receptor, family 2, subfamily B, member 2-like [Bos taurus]
MEWDNQTFNPDFILMGIFSYTPTHVFLFSLVLGIFTMALLANTLMVLVIYLDTRLHTPMYFLLSQLSLMDFMIICTTVPKMAHSYLSGRKSISVAGYEAEICFCVSLCGAECFLLAVMAYDRYVAICYPLQYPSLMNWNLCRLMAASSWFLGVFDGIVDVAVTLSFSYCSQAISQFFCDVPALLHLSCMDTSTFETLIFICCEVMLLLPLSLINISYTCVIITIIRMSSGEVWHKTFTICTSHLIVVGLYYGVAMFIYKRPTSNRSPAQDKMVSAFYTILTPMLNPLIYSLQNKDVAKVFSKVLGKK